MSTPQLSKRHRTRDQREIERLRSEGHSAQRKLHGRALHRTGERTEHIAARALETLRTESAIRSFVQLDERGSDFRVVDRDGREVRVQVKTSELGAEEHRQRYPDIPVLVVPRFAKDRATRLRDDDRLAVARKRLYHLLRQVRRRERDAAP